MLAREKQNLRFQVQDRDSMIQRLEFKLEREQRDRARGLSSHMNDTLTNSRVRQNARSPGSPDANVHDLASGLPP